MFFEEEARKLEGIECLGQGTIYPDIIESSTKTAKIVKSHHNVGGLPEDMNFELVEPLKMLLRMRSALAARRLACLTTWFTSGSLSLAPALASAALGAITKERLEAVRESDAILREEFAAAGLNTKVWRYFYHCAGFQVCWREK